MQWDQACSQTWMDGIESGASLNPIMRRNYKYRVRDVNSLDRKLSETLWYYYAIEVELDEDDSLLIDFSLEFQMEIFEKQRHFRVEMGCK